MNNTAEILIVGRSRIATKDGRELCLVKSLIPVSRKDDRSAGWDIVTQFSEIAMESKLSTVPGVYAVDLELRPIRGKLETVIGDCELLHAGFPS